MAPPQTRGSTRVQRWARRPARGSPADAGIDPSTCVARGCGRWLPRRRGDRPFSASALACEAMAPPQTRGSTHRIEHGDADQIGSPADAGIDPPRQAASCRHRWLPRRRGDRPQAGQAGQAHRPAPPQTRGSTRLSAPPTPSPRGSPADAGIDPDSHLRTGGGEWLPRRRGDRPRRGKLTFAGFGAPPQTRGSTLNKPSPSVIDMGSPADAGIDPFHYIGAPDKSWLPRRRGDRPVAAGLAPGAGMAPPQTRGSTRREIRPGRSARGSPADAGIDPEILPGCRF